MTTPRSYRLVRQSPTDLDDAGEVTPTLEFDYRRSNVPGTSSWPERHCGMKFGPNLIRKALTAGFYVMAEIPEAPRPVVVNEARWYGPVFEVLTLEGYRIPDRVFTVTSLKGYKL